MIKPKTSLFFLVISLSLFCSSEIHAADSQNKQESPQANRQIINSKEGIDKRFVLAPLVISNPAFGDGGGVAAIYFMGEKNKQRRSRMISQLLYSNSDSYAGVLGSILHLDDDRIRAKVFGVNARIRNSFDDLVGGVAKYDTDISFIRGEYLTEIADNLYLGPLISYKNAEYTPTNEQALDYFERLGIQDNESVIVGGMLSYDTRDNDNFPDSGLYFASSIQVSEESLGGEDNYQINETELNHYHQLNNGHVIAVRHYGRFSFDAPYAGQAKLGQRNDLRGYTSGEIVNEHLFSNQIEYRWTTKGKWSYVGFVGIAGMYDGSMTDLDDAEWYRSIGLGLRYRLQDAQRVNFRVDLAIGDDDNDGFYVSLKEAF